MSPAALIKPGRKRFKSAQPSPHREMALRRKTTSRAGTGDIAIPLKDRLVPTKSSAWAKAHGTPGPDMLTKFPTNHPAWTRGTSANISKFRIPCSGQVWASRSQWFDFSNSWIPWPGQVLASVDKKADASASWSPWSPWSKKI